MVFVEIWYVCLELVVVYRKPCFRDVFLFLISLIGYRPVIRRICLRGVVESSAKKKVPIFGGAQIFFLGFLFAVYVYS